MYTVEVWEQGNRLSGLLRGLLPETVWRGTVFLPAGRCFGERKPDLAVVSPQWNGGLMAGDCRCLLIPGNVGTAGGLSAGWVVSYGLDRRDTLTLSAMEPGKLWSALQREIVTLDGTVVEGQEFPLSNRRELPPMEALACVGVQLLLGIPPEGVRLE